MKKTIRRFFIISLILVLFIMGCGAAVTSKTGTVPTQSIQLEITQSAQVQPTTPPQLTPMPTAALPVMKVYEHPSNSFSISVPTDWTESENKGFVLLYSPDHTAQVELLVENTANTLDTDAFTKVINAFEFNIYSSINNYKETQREVQGDRGYAIITKTMDLDTVPYQASTIYEQKGKVLYIESYYTTVSDTGKSGPLFTAMGNSFKTNSASAEELSPFTSAPFPYTDPGNLYRLLIPLLWTYDDVNKNGSVISYTSPDDNALIRLYKKDLGKTTTRALADSNALEQLKAIASDARVSKTETLKNGSLKMTWASKSANLQGTSIYQWSGTKWFFLTWMVNGGFENIYAPAFNQSIASFETP